MAKVTEDEIRKNAEAMLAEMEKAELKSPRTGKPGSDMPLYGKPPELSPEQKAANKKKLDAKIKANQPAPKSPSKPSAPPSSPKSPVKLRPGVDVPHTDDGFRRMPVDDSPYIGVPKPIRPASDTDKMLLAKQAEMSKLPPTMASNAYQPGAGKPLSSPMNRMGSKSFMPQPTSMGEMGGGGYGDSGGFAMKRGGKVRDKSEAKFSSGGSTSKASSRGDGIAQRGKTKGRYI